MPDTEYHFSIDVGNALRQPGSLPFGGYDLHVENVIAISNPVIAEVIGKSSALPGTFRRCRWTSPSPRPTPGAARIIKIVYGGYYGNAITFFDKAVLTEVPEPAFLLPAGCLGFAALLMRRRRL